MVSLSLQPVGLVCWRSLTGRCRPIGKEFASRWFPPGLRVIAHDQVVNLGKSVLRAVGAGLGRASGGLGAGPQREVDTAAGKEAKRKKPPNLQPKA